MQGSNIVRRFLQSASGGAAAEFVIVAPFIIVLLFGAIEGGRLLNDFHTVSKSVRDATRYLSRVPASCPGGAGAGTIDNATDETIARNLVLTGSIDPPGNYLLGYWTDPNTINIAVNCIDNAGNYEGVYAGVPTIPRLTVTASVPFNFIFSTLVMNSGSLTLTVSHNEAHIGE